MAPGEEWKRERFGGWGGPIVGQVPRKPTQLRCVYRKFAGQWSQDQPLGWKWRKWDGAEGVAELLCGPNKGLSQPHEGASRVIRTGARWLGRPPKWPPTRLTLDGGRLGKGCDPGWGSPPRWRASSGEPQLWAVGHQHSEGERSVLVLENQGGDSSIRCGSEAKFWPCEVWYSRGDVNWLLSLFCWHQGPVHFLSSFKVPLTHTVPQLTLSHYSSTVP